MIFIKKILLNFYNLFIPRKCLNCGRNLNKTENQVCLDCLQKIPKTHFLYDFENEANKIFWGRISLNMVASFYYFSKDSILQNLIHQIKYDGKKELALELGKFLAMDLKKAELYRNIDFITSVPMHKIKQKNRGYNQSDWIAKGVSEILSIPFIIDILVKHKNTKSQTNKNRLERLENVKSVFSLNSNYNNLENKHILIIDDVLTTGATLEACCIELLKIPNAKVSAVTLAIASD